MNSSKNICNIRWKKNWGIKSFSQARKMETPVEKNYKWDEKALHKDGLNQSISIWKNVQSTSN